MISRRDALGLMPLLMELAHSNVHAQAPSPAGNQAGAAPSGPTTAFRHDLPALTMEDWEVTVSWVNYPPGRVGTPHRHPGFTLAYVLEGSVIAKISGQDERTFTVGEMFFEPPGSIHEVSKNASQTQPAKLLAMNFSKKGEPKTAPA